MRPDPATQDIRGRAAGSRAPIRRLRLVQEEKPDAQVPFRAESAASRLKCSWRERETERAPRVGMPRVWMERGVPPRWGRMLAESRFVTGSEKWRA